MLNKNRHHWFGEKIKQRQTNVEETGLWETIIRVAGRGTKQSLATNTHPVRSRPMVLVQAQCWKTVSTTHALAF